MYIIDKMKGALDKMTKALAPHTETSALGKRKLNFDYSGFFSSASRPPLASPKLEKNCGVQRNGISRTKTKRPK